MEKLTEKAKRNAEKGKFKNVELKGPAGSNNLCHKPWQQNCQIEVKASQIGLQIKQKNFREMIKELNKEIFGKNYRFLCDDTLFDDLSSSVYLYPNAEFAIPHVEVKVVLEMDLSGSISRNPSNFLKMNEGMIMNFGGCLVSWGWGNDGILMVKFCVLKIGGLVRNMISRLKSMEYSSSDEHFEQLLHELVLVPSTYFFDDLAIVHSAVLSIDGKAILLAGTGGTGKTSALLSLRTKDKVSFVADDIAVVSTQGFVYPNLAWPKVYGYNLSSYISANELLGGRGLLDRMQFFLKLKRNPKSVRRKIRPDKLYRSVTSTPTKIARVIYLFRDNSSSINLSPLSLDKTVEMTTSVIKTEYSNFNNFLEWDLYNATAADKAPYIEINQRIQSWKRNLADAFKCTELSILRIPFSMEHEDYLKYMEETIVKI